MRCGNCSYWLPGSRVAWYAVPTERSTSHRRANGNPNFSRNAWFSSGVSNEAPRMVQPMASNSWT
jgi:hypothetical protein